MSEIQSISADNRENRDLHAAKRELVTAAHEERWETVALVISQQHLAPNDWHRVQRHSHNEQE